MIVKTASKENVCTKILKRNGFVFAGIVQDDDIADAWEWIWNERKEYKTW